MRVGSLIDAGTSPPFTPSSLTLRGSQGKSLVILSLPAEPELHRHGASDTRASQNPRANAQIIRFEIDVTESIHYPFALSRGHSSAGRALHWHCSGRRFDPDWLHQDLPSWQPLPASPSSRGLGHRPFTAVTGVRIPLGTPFILPESSWEGRANRTTVRFSANIDPDCSEAFQWNMPHLGALLGASAPCHSGDAPSHAENGRGSDVSERFACKNAKPRAARYRVTDGLGLYLEVSPNGSRY
jgi:hypothetical protein